MGWKRILSQKRPAAGGEARELLSYRELQPAEWNCEQDANFYRVVRIKQKASEYENEERRVCSKQFGRQE